MSEVRPPRCVLIVDDQPAVLEALSSLLEFAGFETCAATSPAAAVRALRSTSIQVVLADATLAPTSGAVLLDTVTVRYPHIATVLMSGYRRGNLADMGIEAGAHEFIAKPFRFKDVVATIERALARIPAADAAFERRA